jgi:glycosyltransferase involved in cell wall biosynthesis
MAAGAIVVTPDVGGNRAYCRFGENCVQVGYEDPDSYVEALFALERGPRERIEGLRERGYATLDDHRLERERAEFGRFLIEVSSRCARPSTSLA